MLWEWMTCDCKGTAIGGGQSGGELPAGHPRPYFTVALFDRGM